jgi:hypothetical protein
MKKGNYRNWKMHSDFEATLTSDRPTRRILRAGGHIKKWGRGINFFEVAVKFSDEEKR